MLVGIIVLIVFVTNAGKEGGDSSVTVMSGMGNEGEPVRPMVGAADEASEEIFA